MMTQGMKTFDSTGMRTEKYVPPQPAFYEATLDASAISGEQTNDGRPFVGGVKFKLHGTGEGGQPDKTVRATFWLGTQKTEKGAADILRKSGLVPLARAFGEELTGIGAIDVTLPDGKNYECLSIADVKAWLQAHDGRTLKLKTKLRASKEDATVQYAEVALYVEQPAGSGVVGSAISIPS